MKTPISYYGGKQSIISEMIPIVPIHETYTETYFGGGTLFFEKKPAVNETINDRLDIVINFYQVLKNNFRALKKLIDASLISKTQHRLAQHMINGKIKCTKIEKAWAFWYACNFSHNSKLDGGLRFSNHNSMIPAKLISNKKNSFTELLVKRIENAQIENRDALWVLNSRNVTNAFHYIDPPYPNADQGHYKGFTFEHLDELLSWCANDCKGKFLLSNFNSLLLDSYIKNYGWHKKEIVKKLAKPRKTGERKIEVLVYNYDTHPNLFQQDFVKENFSMI